MGKGCGQPQPRAACPGPAPTMASRFPNTKAACVSPARPAGLLSANPEMPGGHPSVQKPQTPINRPPWFKACPRQKPRIPWSLPDLRTQYWGNLWGGGDTVSCRPHPHTDTCAHACDMASAHGDGRPVVGGVSHLSWDGPADGDIYKTIACTPRVLGSYFQAFLSK